MSQRSNLTNSLDGLRATFRGLRLSLVETVFLAAAVLFAVFVVAFYLTKIAPRQLELSRLKDRAAAARVRLEQEAKREGELNTQRENAQKILDSLADFETRMKDKNDGKSQVMDEFPQLASANQVSGGGVTFRTIEPDAATTDNNGNPAQLVARNDKLVNVYPALGLDTTVEGDYHNLRRFISDLERSKQFIIINAITLQSVDENARRLRGGAALGAAPGQPPRPGAARPAQDPTTTIVSLKIETDTYFQKRP